MPDDTGRDAHVSDRRAGILIVGMNYTPEHTANAPYTAEMAEYLVSAGCEVTMVTAMPHYPAWRVAPEYAGRRAMLESVNGVTVVRRAVYVPTRQSVSRRMAYEASFVLAAFPVTRIEKPDMVIGVMPALSGGVLARLFAARWRVPYGVIVQNLTGQAVAVSGIGNGGRSARASAGVERWALARARAIAPVSAGFFPYLQTELKIPSSRLLLMPNWTHIASPTEDRAAVRARLGWDDGRQVVLHAGNMGIMQDLDQVLRAAKLANERNEAVRFVLLGDGSQRASLESRAFGMANVVFMDPVPAAGFPDVLGAADVLLITERPTTRETSLPSKLTSYAAAGRPVVAAVDPRGMTASEVTRAAMGIVVPSDSPGALLGALRRLARDPAEATRLGGEGSVYAATSLSSANAHARIENFIARIGGVG